MFKRAAKRVPGKLNEQQDHGFGTTELPKAFPPCLDDGGWRHEVSELHFPARVVLTRLRRGVRFHSSAVRRAVDG
jgi:hypothetical protein